VWAALVAVALTGAVALTAEPASAAVPQASATTATTQAPVVKSRPDVKTAVLAARTQGAAVTVDGLTTESSITVANPDGSLTQNLSMGTARVRQSDGSWADVDLSLAPVAGGFAPRVSPVPVSVSGGGGTTAVSESVAGGVVQVGWADRLPAPTIAGDMATYPDVRPGVDLVVQILRTGFEVSFVVRTRPSSQLSLPLTLTLQGLSADAAADGSLALRGADGKQVGTGGVPVGFDAAKIPLTSLPLHSKPIPAGLSSPVVGSLAAMPGNSALASGTASGATQVQTRTWTLEPDQGFMTDPSVQYPVTLDPSYNFGVSSDSYVKSDVSTSQYYATRLYIGTPNSGGIKARTLLHLDSLPGLSGYFIDGAYLQLFNTYSATCGADVAPVYVYTSGSWTSNTTWSTKPALVGLQGTANFVHNGPNNGCGGAAYDRIYITPLVQAWADGTNTTRDLQVTASETDTHGWKEFTSVDNGSGIPAIYITYRAYPGTPSTPVLSPAVGTGPSSLWTSTTTPTLSAKITSSTGNYVQGRFEIYSGGSTLVWQGLGNTVASGGTSSVSVPAGQLAAGVLYTVRVWGVSGGAVSKTWSDYIQFQVDTTAPATPSVSSTTFPAGAWNTAGGSGAFTFTTTSTDIASWRYRWNGASSWTPIATAASSVTPTLTPPAGLDTLTVEAIDRAGNVSADGTYTFGSGTGLTSPTDAQRTQGYLTLGGQAPHAATTVRFRYTLPGGTFADIPPADVTLSGTALTAWPVSTDTTNPSSAAAPANLVWQARKTLAYVDGPVQVQAVFSDGTTTWTTTNPVTAVLDQKALGSSFATTTLGPVGVSLLTGNSQVSATDANVAASGSALLVSRTFNSFDTTTAGIFGPGWAVSLPVPSASVDWRELDDLGSYVQVTDSEGGLTFFSHTTSPVSAYTPVGEAAGLSLTAGSDTFTVSDPDGVSATFTKTGSGTPSPSNPVAYQLTNVLEPGTGNASSFAYNTDGTPAVMIAPHPSGTTCPTTGNQPAGCRVLAFGYTTVAGHSQVASITLKTADGSGAAQSVDVACYRYDATTGRLTSAWDPRITGTTCPAYPTAATAADLPTGYGYDTAGRISTITPPGLAGWSLGYDTASPARLTTVTRTHTGAWGGGSEVSTIVYGAPIGSATSADETHPDLTASTVAGWAQTDLPVTATVVYGPGDTVSSSDLRDGTVHALDVNGRETNTASFSGTGQGGWKVDTTEYDSTGNTARTLSAANRDRALSPDASEMAALGLTGASSTDIARALDTRTFYTADGLDVTDTYGPLHTMVVSTSTTPVAARTHTHNSYGTVDYPATTPTDWLAQAPAHQIQSTATGASVSRDPFGATDVDVRTTTTAYALSSTDHAGWDLRAPMATTTVIPGGTDIVKQTRYDATTGAVIETRQPSAAGVSADPGTTLTTYYSAGTRNDANCVNSAWWGQVCKTAPGAQPTTTGLPGLPTTTTTYDGLLRPTTSTETVTPAGGGSVTTTTTTAYRATWSPQVQSVATTGGTGTAVPAVTTTYDPDNTGLVAATSDGTHALARLYDDFGRETQRTTTDSALTPTTTTDRTTTTYDSTGRVSTVTYLKGDLTTQVGQTTFGYDGGTEHRGLITSVTHSGIGTVTGSYDADGALTAQNWPSSVSGGTAMTQTWTTDPTGDPTSLTYAQGGTTWLTDTQTSNAFGQWENETGTALPFDAREYGYDPAGRLTTVAEQGTPGDSTGCITRTYTYAGTPGLNGNRSARAAYPADTAGACSTTTTAISTQAQTFSYDNADRLTSSGVTYDTNGRITTMPAGLLTAGAAAANANLTYYITDLVRSMSQTVSGTTTTRTWYLDANQRLQCWHEQTSGTAPATCATAAGDHANHYGGDGDSPSWTLDTPTTGAATTHWYVTGLDGNLAADAATTSTGATTVTFQMAGLHGDIECTTSQGATGSPDGPLNYADEYGVTTSAGARYGWLGAKQRPQDALTGLVLMGVRIYSPALGRFTSVDPIPGGNTTPYTYPQDPINGYDLDGKCWGWGCEWTAKHVFQPVWENRATIIQYAGYAAAGACIVATAGVCTAAAFTVAGISSLNRIGSFVRRGNYSRQSVMRLTFGVVFDLVSASMPGARFGTYKYLSRHAMSGRHVLRQAYIPLRQTFKYAKAWRRAGGIGLGAAWTRFGWSQ
jgi:RHS repeat-associated protein